jgi:hypothetical protein
LSACGPAIAKYSKKGFLLMKPLLKDSLAWNQAELLMQPALIRIIDNIRQHLDASEWEGTYQEIQEPIPGYRLCLQRQDKLVSVDLWDLCYQICFSNYSHPPLTPISGDDSASMPVEVDTSLIDEENQDVDWERLDNKAHQLVDGIFANLP